MSQVSTSLRRRASQHDWLVKALLSLMKLLAGSLDRLMVFFTSSIMVVVVPRESFNADGLITDHDSSFMNERSFQAAYAKAVASAGADWDIPWRTHVALWAAKSAIDIEGDYVELGTGRAWRFSAICQYLPWNEMSKSLWLCDRFSPFGVDPVTGLPDQTSNPHPCYARSLEATKANFEGLERINFVEGTLPESLQQLEIARISFLHIDLNNSETEIESLRYLWPSIAPGGLILMDDYAYAGYKPQYLAMNALANELGVLVLSLPTGQGLIVKPGLTINDRSPA